MAKANPAPKVETRKITEFTPDPSNANLGTERGMRMLDDSVAESGMGRSIVVDKNGFIIAGNKTTETAVDHGIEEAIVVHTAGHQVIVHQRDDLDLLASDPNNPARKMATRDNRSGEVNLNWSPEQLLADVNAGFNFNGIFDPQELDELLDRVNFLPVDIGEQPRLDQKKPIVCPHCGMEFTPNE